MIVLKFLGAAALTVILGSWIILRLIERQANLLFGHYRKRPKSQDEKTYEEVNPIWNDIK